MMGQAFEKMLIVVFKNRKDFEVGNFNFYFIFCGNSIIIDCRLHYFRELIDNVLLCNQFLKSIVMQVPKVISILENTTGIKFHAYYFSGVYTDH